MPMVTEDFLLQLLQACAARGPEPLYPARFGKEQNLDRDKLDVGLEELRRRGLVKLTDWMKDLGQGYVPTDAGKTALTANRLPTARAAPVAAEQTSEVTHYQRGEIVRRAIFAPEPARVTWILLAACLLYFAYGAVYAGQNGLGVSDYLQGGSEATSTVLQKLGAVHPVLVFPHLMDGHHSDRPQFERIVLFLFLHVGIFHLAMNMYFLGTLAQQIEAMWGWHRFLIIYFIAGIVSGCVILLFNLTQNPPWPLTAGASGSLFGIFVAMVVWFWLNREHLPEGLVQDWSRNLGINAVLLIAINFFPNVSWQGHLGGAIGGLLAALLLHVNRFHPSAVVRFLAVAALPLIPLGFFLAVLFQAGWFN